MRSTLFFIPHEIAGIPLFGIGWLLGVLILAFLGWAVYHTQILKKPSADLVASLPVVFIAAAVVVFVLPGVEQNWPDGTPIGLPIRGYGVMVLLGLLAGIGITVWRGKQLGVDPDTVVGLGFWMMLIGVLGARTFYVVQKWEEFGGATIGEQLTKIVKLTEGGLVIYGGVMGGILGGAVFCWSKRLKILAVADLIVPGFLIGLAFGRIGCLLHGCCFGGVCHASLPAISFPQGTSPYAAQIASAELLGITLASNTTPTRIEAIEPDSLAARVKLEAGSQIEKIDSFVLPIEQGQDPASAPQMLVDLSIDGRRITLPPTELPARSLPVHPAQLYAAFNALLLCVLMWHFQPIPRRDGVVFCAAIVLYAISRFLLEGVRSDEGGQLGTFLTIAQLVGIASIIAGVVGCLLVLRQPAGRSWQWSRG